MDLGRFEEAESVLNQIDDSNHDLVKWAQLELGVHTGTDGLESRIYIPCIGSAIQQDAMVPIIDSGVDSVGILTTGTRTYFCRCNSGIG